MAIIVLAWYSTSNPFRNYRCQCTWYACGRALKNGIQLSCRSNAKTLTSGVVSTLRANSIAVYTGGEGEIGHVAFVEAFDVNLY